MDEEIKMLAHKTVDCIVRKVRRSIATEFYSLEVISISALMEQLQNMLIN